MTHRERLQKMISSLDKVYDEVGYLRDHSTTEMQRNYNEVRQQVPLIMKALSEIDNKLMPDSLAQKEL